MNYSNYMLFKMNTVNPLPRFCVWHSNPYLALVNMFSLTILQLYNIAVSRAGV